MPAAIPIALAVGASAAGAGAAAGGVTILGVALSSTALTAMSAGLGVVGTLAQTLMQPTPPKPKMQDGDASIKQAIPPRTRGYGRLRQGGYFIYYDSTPDGDLKTVLQHLSHECDAVEEDWLNDQRVTLDGDGNVTDDPYWQGDDSVVVIQHYLGSPSQTVPSFDPRWTAAHRARGLCVSYIKYADLKDEEQVKAFPNNAPPHRVVLRAAKIFDPRDGDQTAGDEATYAWSDNAALVILDFLTRTEQGVPVGFGIDLAMMDLGSFSDAADVSDETIALKAGGVEKRWRIWGAYDLTENLKDVLRDMLDACGGRLTYGPDGKIGLVVGAPNPVAAVTINDDQILEYSDLFTGKPATERVNEVRATYVSEAWEWAETEAGIQKNQAAIDRNGIESSQIKLRFVPSESQAQRVAKCILRRGDPTLFGRIRTTLAGLDAWGDRWLRLQLSELDVDRVVEIGIPKLDRETMTVEMDVTSYDGWWDWTAATDEQDPAIPPPDTDEGNDVPVPQNVTVAIEHRQINGNTLAAVGVITWDPPPRPVYVGRVRYRPVTTPTASAWQFRPAEQDEQTVDTDPLRDGQQYEAQAQFLGPRRTPSDWSDSAFFTAQADEVAPGVPTGLTAQILVPPVVTLTATTPNSANFFSLQFYRNSSNTFVGATPIGSPFFGAAGTAKTMTDSPGAGDWWYFATASNGSGVTSAATTGVPAEVAPGAPVITDPAGAISSYDRRPPVSGNGAISGATIKLYANAVQVGTGTAAGGGTWTVTPSTDLGLGVNSMTATQSVAGNESVASGSKTITVNAVDADAWAYIVAMTVRPPYARQTLINDLVTALKTAGVWTLLDAAYLLAAHDNQASRLNLKAPATFGLTSQAAGTGPTSPTFTADAGWKGAGAGLTAGGYLLSTFNPTTASSPHFTQNDASMGVWVRTASSAAASGIFREIGNGDNTYIASKNSPAGNMRSASNSATATTTATGGSGTGFYAWSRASSSAMHDFFNTTDLGSHAATSAALTNAVFSLLKSGSAYSDAEICFAFMASSLTATQESDLYNAVHAYLQGVGAVA